MPDVKCISHNSRKSPVAASEPRIQRQKIANNSHQLAITNISIEINPEVLGRVHSVPSNVTSITNDDVSGEQRKEYVVQLRTKTRKNYGLNNKIKNANTEDEKEIRLKESLDASGELLEAMDPNKYEREMKRCRNECEREDIRSAYTEASHVLLESSESYIKQSAKLTENIKMHPEKTNENKIKEASTTMAKQKKLLSGLKKNMEAMKSMDPKLSITLKTLKEKTDKLIDKTQVILEEITELNERIREILNKDKELIEEAEKSINNLDEKFGDLLKELVEESVDRKNAENKEFIQKTVDKKNYDDQIDRYFEQISQKKRNEKALIIRY